MSGGGRPRGWFDDVPTIGSGQEPGSGDGSSSAVQVGIFDDIPTLPATLEESAFAPPPAPTTLRDRLAKPLDLTAIPPEREADFQDWIGRNQVEDLDDPESHYDYRGAYLAGVDRGADGHWPDTFKQHGHPTFSRESEYSRGPGDGGEWIGDQFTPAPPPSASPYPANVQKAATPGPEGEFITGFAGEAAKATIEGPIDIARSVVGTVFGNPTAEELANPLVRASIVNRMGRMPDVQPSTVDPLEQIAELGAGLVNYPVQGAKAVVQNPDPYEKGKGAAAAVLGAAGLLGMAHGIRTRFRPGGPMPGTEPPIAGEAEGGQAPEGAPEPPPRPDEAPPTDINRGEPPKPEPPAVTPPPPAPEPVPENRPPTTTEAGRALERAQAREAESNRYFDDIPPEPPQAQQEGVKVGDIIRTSYNTGPYRVVRLGGEPGAQWLGLEEAWTREGKKRPEKGFSISDVRQEPGGQLVSREAHIIRMRPEEVEPWVKKSDEEWKRRGRGELVHGEPVVPAEDHPGVRVEQVLGGPDEHGVWAYRAYGGAEGRATRIDQFGHWTDPETALKRARKESDELLNKIQRASAGRKKTAAHREDLDRLKHLTAAIDRLNKAVKPAPRVEPRPTDELAGHMETEGEPVPAGLEIHPESRAAQQGETSAEDLYRGSREQARAHAMRSLNAQLKLEEGKNEKGRPWSAKEIKFLEHEQKDGAHLYTATIEEIGQTFGQPVAEKLNDELVREFREVAKLAKGEPVVKRSEPTAPEPPVDVAGARKRIQAINEQLAKGTTPKGRKLLQHEREALVNTRKLYEQLIGEGEPEPIDLGGPQKRAPLKAEKQAKAQQREANRAARYEKVPTQELLELHHATIERVGRSAGGNGWARYDDDIGETRAGGTNRNARLEDDKRILDGVEAELKKRGIGEDELIASYYEWTDRKAEREGMQQEENGKGMGRNAADFNPDELAMPKGQGDIFGDIPLEGETQGSMFDEKAGTEASRSTPEGLRALAGEREKLQQLIKGRLKESPSANRRLAELDRILNRDQKISADEMSTRARAKEDLELGMPPKEPARPYKLEDLDTAGDRQVDRWIRYEEDLAGRELLDQEAGGEPRSPGGPSKTVDELTVLENELQAAERKLAEVKSEKLKTLLEAQVYNRTRQQAAYVKEYFTAGREGELPEAVRKRFPNMKKDEPQPEPEPPRGQQQRGGSRDEDARRRAREAWEERMREQARRRQQERDRFRDERAREQERQQRDRDQTRSRREERERERQRAEPPPPPRPKPPPPPSMAANPNVPPPKTAGGRVRSLWRIGRTFADALDATVYQGRGRPRFPNMALGFYKVFAEAIRVQRGDWLDVIAHEVGHHLSKVFLGHPTRRGGFRRNAIALTPEMKSELTAMGRNLYGTRKAALGYAEEGIAEWVHFYVTDPARLTREAPKFTEFMEKTVFKDVPRRGPQLEKGFAEAREHYARFEHATPIERIKAMIDRDPKRGKVPEIRRIATRWLDDLEEFRRFDEAAGIDPEKPAHAQQSVYYLARLARGAPARAQGWLNDGMVDIRDGRIVGKSVIDALTQVGERNFPDFDAYLVARTAIERWEAGINPGVRLQDAKDVVRDYDARFKAPAQVIWDHYRLLLEAKLHAGQLTRRAFDAIRARNKEHVGLYRVFDDFELPASGQGGGGRGIHSGPNLPRQKGSARDIISPIESIGRDTYRTAASLSRYEALKALVRVSQGVEGMGHVVDKVPAPIEVTKIYAPHVLEQLRALGLAKVDPLTGDPIPLEASDLLGEVLTAFHEAERPGASEMKDLVIPIRVGESTDWYQVRDRKLYNAIEGLDRPEMADWLRWLGAPVRGFRAGVTLTTQFIVKNIFRDAGTAMIRSRSSRPVLPFEHLVTGAFHWLHSPELVQRWRESGGDNATQLGLDRATTSHNMKRLVRQNGHGGWKAYDVVRHPVDAIRMLSSIGENVTRLGEYAIVERQLLKKGRGPIEAQTRGGFASRDVTQDFWMAGTAGRAVNQIVAFFNASLNSVANHVRDLRTRPEVVVPRLLVGITLPSLYLYMSQRKDPEYKRIPRWQKDLGWIVLQRGDDRSAGWDGYGTGKIKHRWFIPKPFELGVLWGSTFERIAEWVETKKPDAWDQFDQSLETALSPGFVPHLLMLAHELKSNRDEFRDRAIVPRGLEDVDPRYQSRSTTGETARALGDAAPGRGISPAKIEHAVQGVAGGMGSAALGAADAGVRAFRNAVGLPPLRPGSTVLEPDPNADPLTEVPGLSGLVRRDPKEQAEDIDKIYRQYERAEQTRKTWMYLLKEGRRQEADDYLKQHRDEIRSVATKDQAGIEGTLRRQYNAVQKLRQAGRANPDQRDRMIDRMHRLTER